MVEKYLKAGKLSRYKLVITLVPVYENVSYGKNASKEWTISTLRTKNEALSKV